MGSIYPRNGKWYVSYYCRNGKRLRFCAGPNKGIAELSLKDLEVKDYRNQLGFLDKKDVAPETFFADYLQYSQTNHRPATTVRYRSAVQNFLEFLKLTPEVVCLRDISPELIEKYKHHRRCVEVSKNGKKGPLMRETTIQKGAKSNTINFELGTLRTIFNLAIQQKYLEDNPVRGVRFLKPDDAKQRRSLTEAEIDRFLRACEPGLYPVFFVMLHTGMRRGELINLEWRDLDFDRRVVKVRRKPFWVPKTGEREIPMSKAVADVLSNLPRESHFVFADKKGNALNGNQLREELIRIAKNAGIYDLTMIHSLRHTFGSHLAQKVDLPSVQKLMGHSKIETTLRYIHQTPEHLHEAVEKLNFEQGKTKEVKNDEEAPGSGSLAPADAVAFVRRLHSGEN